MSCPQSRDATEERKKCLLACGGLPPLWQVAAPPPRTPHPPIINIQAQATYLSNCASKAIALGGKSPPRTKSQASCAP